MIRKEDDKTLIDEYELKWIFAVKDNKVQWHYNEYYGSEEGEPSKSTLVSILYYMMWKTGGWTTGIHRVYHNPAVKVVEKRNLYEWLYDVIVAWCKNVTVEWLDENGPINWREIVEAERSIPERRQHTRGVI